MNIAIPHYTLTTACGAGLDNLRQALKERRSGLRQNDLSHSDLPTWIGRVQAVDDADFPEHYADWLSRNNELAWIGLNQDGFMEAVDATRKAIGSDRLACMIGTSTSSIGRTEEAYRHLEDGDFAARYLQSDVHNPHSPAAFVAMATGAEGPSLTVSTACSSGAKVFAGAARWLNAGLADAVIVGGVDSLCLSVLHGFASLGLTSERKCRPFDAERDGISIGEAAGFALLRRAADAPDSSFKLLGYGESADAHHMSHPHPEGAGADLAMSRAFARGNIDSAKVDYINLHGTASKANDLIESRVLARHFNGHTVAGSSKAWTGHALGAAGIVEALIALDVLHTGLIPGTLESETLDPELGYPITLENTERTSTMTMSNSFGFGGNNCCVVFGR